MKHAAAAKTFAPKNDACNHDKWPNDKASPLHILSNPTESSAKSFATVDDEESSNVHSADHRRCISTGTRWITFTGTPVPPNYSLSGFSSSAARPKRNE